MQTKNWTKHGFALDALVPAKVFDMFHDNSKGLSISAVAFRQNDIYKKANVTKFKEVHLLER